MASSDTLDHTNTGLREEEPVLEHSTTNLIVFTGVAGASWHVEVCDCYLFGWFQGENTSRGFLGKPGVLPSNASVSICTSDMCLLDEYRLCIGTVTQLAPSQG